MYGISGRQIARAIDVVNPGTACTIRPMRMPGTIHQPGQPQLPKQVHGAGKRGQVDHDASPAKNSSGSGVARIPSKQ